MFSVDDVCQLLCPNVFDPMDCSTPGFPVLHHLPEFAQTHVHCGDGNGTPLQSLAWKIPWTEVPGRLQSMGSRRVGHDWVTSLPMHWRRKWQPTPVFLTGESKGWRILVGCHQWGCRVGHNRSDLAAVAAACPLSQWCHPAISSSVSPFFFCPQSFLASRSFPVSRLFASGGQSIGAFSFLISPSNEYSGLISFRIDWFDLLGVQGTLKSLLQHQFFGTQPSLWFSSHIRTWLLQRP